MLSRNKANNQNQLDQESPLSSLELGQRMWLEWVSLHGALEGESSQDCPCYNVFISEPYKTRSERQLAVRGETGQLLSGPQRSSLHDFHGQHLLTVDWLSSLHPLSASFHFYFFWLLAETFWEFFKYSGPSQSVKQQLYLC